MRFDVVTRGPYAPASPRADRTVASVMPGDLIEATPFVVGPDGPVDLEAVKPAWFYCRATRCFTDTIAAEPPRDCAVEAVGPAETCRIGEAARARLQLGEQTSFLDLFDDPPALYMIAGTPDGPSTDECLARLGRINDVGETLQPCLLIIKPLPLGPLWRLMLVAAVTGLADAVPLDFIPDAAIAADPSLYPAVLPFELTITGVDGETREQIAGPGDTVVVAPEEQVRIVAPVDPFDAQVYYDALLSAEGVPLLQPQIETFSSTWLFTTAVSFAYDGTVPQTIDWAVPEGASGAIHGYYLLGDGRTTVWAWLRFEVHAP